MFIYEDFFVYKQQIYDGAKKKQFNLVIIAIKEMVILQLNQL